MTLTKREARLGGNYTEPNFDLWRHTGEVEYYVYVNWEPLPETYETAVEAECALHEALGGDNAIAF